MQSDFSLPVAGKIQVQVHVYTMLFTTVKSKLQSYSHCIIVTILVVVKDGTVCLLTADIFVYMSCLPVLL